MAPCWVLLVVVMRGVFIEVIAFGPDFSSQAWSIIWVAIV